MIPELETSRLRMRAPRVEDFDLYVETLTSPRARYIGGPFDRKGAWRDFCMDVASWRLRGFGYWSVEEKASGAFTGFVGLGFPVYHPERELGWVMQAGFEGKGYAFEAATAARAHAYDTLGWRTLVSYIDAPNERSIALAERLGARLDPDAPHPDDDPCLVYRHPAPENLQ